MWGVARKKKKNEWVEPRESRLNEKNNALI
jgi:hypothetical protein